MPPPKRQPIQIAVAAVFSIANGVLLTDLPYPDPDRLVLAHATTQGGDRYGLFSHQEVVGLQDAIEDTRLAAYSYARQPLVVEGVEPADVTYEPILR